MGIVLDGFIADISFPSGAAIAAGNCRLRGRGCGRIGARRGRPGFSRPQDAASGSPLRVAACGRARAAGRSKAAADPKAGRGAGARRIRILAPGSVPPDVRTVDVPRGAPNEQGFDLKSATRIAALGARGFGAVTPSPPRGFTVDLAEQIISPNAGGVIVPSHAYYRFVANDQYEISVEVHRFAKGVDGYLVAFEASTGIEMSSLQVEGVEVILVGGNDQARFQAPSEANFVLSDYGVSIYGHSLPPDVLVEFVTNWIQNHRGCTQATATHRANSSLRTKRSPTGGTPMVHSRFARVLSFLRGGSGWRGDGRPRGHRLWRL
jgi:hypothetical protein